MADQPDGRHFDVPGAAPAGMYRGDPEPTDWGKHCAANSAELQQRNKDLGEKILYLDQHRATLGEPNYLAQRRALERERESLDSKWALLKAYCADHRYDIGRIERSQPPAYMPPRNAEEAAADERERVAARAESDRIAAVAASREAMKRDALEPSLPGNLLIDGIAAGIAGATRAAAGAVIEGALATGRQGAGAAATVVRARAGGQCTLECNTFVARYANANGMPVELVEGAGAGVFNPAAGMSGVRTHLAVRNFDGTITDATILNNIRQLNNGVIPQELEQFARYDTFDPATYARIFDEYVRVAQSPHW